MTVEVLAVDGVVGGKKNGTAGEPGFDGVHGAFSFAFFRLWAGAVLGVGAIGVQAGFGDRRWHFAGGSGQGKGGLRGGYGRPAVQVLFGWHGRPVFGLGARRVARFGMVVTPLVQVEAGQPPTENERARDERKLMRADLKLANLMGRKRITGQAFGKSVSDKDRDEFDDGEGFVALPKPPPAQCSPPE